MFSAVQRTSSVINTILNHKYGYTKVIFLRLSEKSSYKILGNHVWDKETLNVFQRFPERYKHFITCRQHSNIIQQDMIKDVISKIQFIPEHKIMHSMMENSIHYKNSIVPPVKRKVKVSYDEICQLYTHDWSNASVSYVYNAIKKIACCYLNGSRFESTLYDSIFLACSNQLSGLNDKQLIILMQHLIVFVNEDEKLSSWLPLLTALDKQCVKRFYPSTIEEMLLIMDVFYQLKYPKSNYIWRSIRKLTSKIDRLSAKNLVQTLFYYSFCNYAPKANMFEVEHHFEECIPELSAIEMAIIGRCFFMKKTRIRNKTVMMMMIRKIKNNILTIDGSFLSSVMKIVRYSDSCYCLPEFKGLLVSLHSEVQRFSLKCLTHVAHAFGALHVYDEILTKSIVERLKNEIKSARLKDIERILFAIYSVAPHNSYYQDTFHTLLNEVLLNYETSRSTEINKYPLSLVRIVTYATAFGIYLPKLIQHIMQPTFIQQMYKNNMRFLTSDLLLLHCFVKIEFPHYQDLLLSERMYNQLTKKYLYTDDVDRKEKKLKILSEIVFLCKNNLGLNVCVDNILPHFLMKDIVIGFDEHNKSIEVESILSSMPDGSIKYVNNGELKKINWACLNIIYFGQQVSNQKEFTGHLYSKMKHLKLIGYRPIPIFESKWNDLPDEKAKENHLRNAIYETRTIF